MTEQDDLDLNEVIPFPPQRIEMMIIIQQDRYDAMRQEIDDLRRQLESRGKANDAYQQEIASLRKELEDADLENERLRARITELLTGDAAEQLRRQVAAMEAERWGPLKEGEFVTPDMWMEDGDTLFVKCDALGWELGNKLPGDVRLCRRVSREGE